MEKGREENCKALIYLHASVLLAGFCGVFGRLITMNEVDIVFYRILFTIAILLVFVGLPRIGWRKCFQIMGCGALLGLHWILFYGSIKMSNVSIGVVCYALIGFFTAFLEPMVFHRKIAIREILFSLLTLVGLLLIFSFDTRYRIGIAVGAVASLVASFFLVFTKKVDEGISTRAITLYEMMGGMVGVIVSAPVYLWIFPSQTGVPAVPDTQNLIYLLCLALFCTVGQYIFQHHEFHKHFWLNTLKTCNLSHPHTHIECIEESLQLSGIAVQELCHDGQNRQQAFNFAKVQLLVVLTNAS